MTHSKRFASLVVIMEDGTGCHRQSREMGKLLFGFAISMGSANGKKTMEQHLPYFQKNIVILTRCTPLLLSLDDCQLRDFTAALTNICLNKFSYIMEINLYSSRSMSGSVTYCIVFSCGKAQADYFKGWALLCDNYVNLTTLQQTQCSLGYINCDTLCCI